MKTFCLSLLFLLALSLLILIYSPFCFAFPEMVRHGYVNCTTCHISPTGGGVLTPYGRESSRTLLSTWGLDHENEAKFAYGVIRPPEWLDVMGMYRHVVTYQNTPFDQQTQFILMQGDVEAAAHSEKWYLDFTLGYQNPPGAQNGWDYLISRRHFINYRPTAELSFRAGRFYPAFGIYIPEHFLSTRRGLGWDESQESYNIEAAWIGERINFYATAILGRLDQPHLNRETGAALTASSSIGDTYKVGASYYYGNGLSTTRHVVGPWGILGFTPHFFLLSEWDFQVQSDKSGDYSGRLGAINYQRLDYEIIQGLHFYLFEDYSRRNFGDPTTLKNSFGIGSQFFPRPHFEINLAWSKLRTASISDSYTDFAWFMLNFYL